MTEVFDALGRPASVYPEPEKYDPEIDDTIYFRYPGLDVELDHRNRVVALHHTLAAATAIVGEPLSAAAIRGALGEPDEGGECTIKRRRRRWSYYRASGLQVDVEVATGRLVGISVGAPERRRK